MRGVNSEEYDQRPGFHIVAPMGQWINDPNGPFYDNATGLYHIFMQHNPYDYVWGNMSWGHRVSDDMVHWMSLDEALTPGPEEYDENGVFSGSMFQYRYPSGKLSDPTIFYTCVDEEENQMQCQAHYDKRALEERNVLGKWAKALRNPIIPQPPPQGDPQNFRDPTVWQEGTQAKLIAAASVEGEGIVAIYYLDLETGEWTYKGQLWNAVTADDAPVHTWMPECPDLIPLPTSDEKLSSQDAAYDFAGTEYAWFKWSCMETRVDYCSIGVYDSTNEKYFASTNFPLGMQVDYGPFVMSYYASKTFFDPSTNRRLLWGWSAESDNATEAEARKWQGVLTIPRTVVFDGQAVRYAPIDEIKSLYISGTEQHIALSLPLFGGDSTSSQLLEGLQSIQSDATFSFKVPELAIALKHGGKEMEQWTGAEFEVGLLVRACLTSNEETKTVNDNAPPAEYTEIGVRIVVHDDLHVSMATVLDTRYSGGTTPRNTSVAEIPFMTQALDSFKASGGVVDMRVLLDNSIAEVFTQSGLQASTMRFYPRESCSSIGFFSRSRGGKEGDLPERVEVHLSVVQVEDAMPPSPFIF